MNLTNSILALAGILSVAAASPAEELFHPRQSTTDFQVGSVRPGSHCFFVPGVPSGDAPGDGAGVGCVATMTLQGTDGNFLGTLQCSAATVEGLEGNGIVDTFGTGWSCGGGPETPALGSIMVMGGAVDNQSMELQINYADGTSAMMGCNPQQLTLCSNNDATLATEFFCDVQGEGFTVAVALNGAEPDVSKEC